ncbi:MAG: hypothetical protein ACM3US_00290 [Sphingomonadaceae bacterium]
MSTTTDGPTITRKELHDYLRKAGWPMAPVEAIDVARAQKAPENVLSVLERIPNRLYLSEGDLWEEFRKAL